MPHRLRVCDIMTPEVVTLAEDETLADASASMERGGVRHLPVVRDGRLIGVVSHRDLLAAATSVFAGVSEREQRLLFARIPVCELMHDAVSVSPDLPVREAAGILLDNRFGCLPVADAGGRLVGIVTATDFLRLTVRVLDALHA